MPPLVAAGVPRHHGGLLGNSQGDFQKHEELTEGRFLVGPDFVIEGLFTLGRDDGLRFRFKSYRMSGTGCNA